MTAATSTSSVATSAAASAGSSPTAAPSARAVPPEPATPAAAPALLVAPEDFSHLVIALSMPTGASYRNLHYEAANALLHRGATDANQIAERWRLAVWGTAGVFALRDSLFSQQDYVYGWTPYALMVPPSWVTTAVVEVAAGRVLRPVRAPTLDDDAAWASLPNAAEMFGSFPPSDGLFRRATRRLGAASAAEARETRASRASVHALAQETRPLLDAAAAGPEAVAMAGAEQIARSDVHYFGESLRYHRVIPILVEHPQNREAVEEGKGFTVVDRTFPPELVRMVRRTVLSRRLLDGDIALERYDLTVPAERAHAIDVLADLIPASDAAGSAAPGSAKLPAAADVSRPRVWLWVTGRLVPGGHTGESAARYLEGFMAELARAPIDHSRLRVLGKPSFDLPAGRGAAEALEREATWYRKRNLPLAVSVTTGPLRALMR
jgi:hypothetical protein